VRVTKLSNKIIVMMEKVLIENGAEIFRINGGVGKAKFSQNMVVSR